MKKIFSLCLLLCLFGIWACGGGGSGGEEPSQPALPKKPEKVAELWVKSFYGNDFLMALRLSTSETKNMIEAIRKELVKDAEVIAFKIYGMTCEIVGDSATCDYIYEEEGQQFEEFISLRMQAGQWLVNERLQEDSTDMQMEMIREELDKIMEDTER